MSAIATAQTSRTGTVSAALPYLVAAGLYLVVLAVGGNLLNDPDSYWHLVVGQWILDHGFPFADPFSFTFTGKPWIAKEWLSQLFFLGAFRLAGWPGMVLLAAGSIAFAFGLLARFLQERLVPIAVLAFAAVAFMLVAPHAVARPHVLALPIMVTWIGGLVSATDSGKAPRYSLLPLMVIWANLHGGFTLGIFLVGAIGLDAIVAAERTDRWRTALVWVRFGLLALIAGCITPYGPQSMLVTWKVLNLGPALSIIDEWRPADFGHIAGLELALLFGAGLALWRGFTLPPVRILILLGLIHMALSAERNADAVGLLAPLFLAGPIALQAPGLRATNEPSHRGDQFAGFLLALLIPVTAAIAIFSNYAPNPRITPAAAVAALKQANAERVLNDYGFGGYLVYEGVPTFIDGRTELYGGDFLARDTRAVTLADLPDFLKLLDEYKIGATLLMPTTPAVALLDTLPGWTRLYADDTAVVHIRTPLRPTLP